MAKLNFSIALGLASKNFKNGLNSAQSSLKGFASSVKRTMGLIAGAFAAGQIKAFASECLNLYKAQQVAETKLQTVMKQRMNATDEQVKSILKLTSAQQELGVVGDEVQIAGAQQVATFLKQKESLETLIPAMNNLIAQQKGLDATQGDAVTIANLMGKAMMGQTSALRRVGITFDEAQEKVLKYGNESQRAAMLAEVIKDNVGDMNAELAKTDLGKIQQMNNILGDTKEKIGGAIAPIVAEFAPAIANMAVSLANGLTSAIATVKSNITTVIEFIVSAFAAIKLAPIFQAWAAEAAAAEGRALASAQAATQRREQLEQEVVNYKRQLKVQEAALAEAEGSKEIAIANKVTVLKEKLAKKELALKKALLVEEQAKTAVTAASEVTTWTVAWNAIKTAGVVCWNTIKAAMISTGIGAIIMAVVLVIQKCCESLYDLVTANGAAEQAAEREAEAARKQKEAHDKVNNAVGDLIGKFKILQKQWKSLKSTSEQNKFLKDNADAFRELGLRIKGTTDAQKVFVKYSELVTKALTAQAKAEAFKDLYKTAVEEAYGNKWKYSVKKAENWNELTPAQQLKYRDRPGDAWKNEVVQTNETEALNKAMEAAGVGKLEKQMNATAEEAGNLAAQLDKVGVSLESPEDVLQDKIVTGTGSHSGSGSHTETPAEKADDIYAKAQLTYSQAIEQAKMRLENGIDTQDDYEKKVYSALEALYGSYSDAYATHPEEKYKTAMNETAELLKTQGKKVEEATKAAEELKKAQEAEADYAKAMAEIEKKRSKGRDTSFDYKSTAGEKVQAQLEFDLELAEDQLEALKQKAETLGTQAIEGLAEAENKVTDLSQRLNLEKVKQDIKDMQKELREAWTEGVTQSWQGLESGVNSVIDMVDKLNDADTSAWEKFCSVIDTLFSLFQTVQSVMETINTIQALSSTLTAAKATAAGLEATNVTAAAAAETAQTGVLSTNAVAALAAAKATEKLAAAQIFAAHASIPFAGVPTATAFVAAMEAAMATVGAFANGGFINGAYSHGDKLFARVNAGEAILNPIQQRNFMRMANGGGIANGVGQSGKVKFEIEGRKLVGVLNNEGTRTGKIN